MRKFLGSHLEELTEAKTVEVDGKTIKIIGPLSNAFTAALHEELKKEKDPVPVVESFTDPNVMAQFVLQTLKERDVDANPLVLYTFDKNDISEEIIVDAAMNANRVATDEDYVVVSTYSAKDYGTPTNKYNNKTYSLENALQSIITKMGGTVVYTGNQLQTAIESHHG